MTDKKHTLDRESVATILAALRYYQEEGLCEPVNRTDAIHDIATDGGNLTSLDYDAIDDLCERINEHGLIDPDHTNKAIQLLDIQSDVLRNQNIAKLPPFCYAQLPHSGEVIKITRGERGYDKVDPTLVALGADKLNESLGVTPAQAEAMVIGSMVGFHVPGANPDYHDHRGTGVAGRNASPEPM